MLSFKKTCRPNYYYKVLKDREAAMSDKKQKIKLEDILKDEEAKKQLLDLLLDTAEEDCQIKLNGKSYKVALEFNLSPIH
jgi:hypothetical protein